MKICRANMNPLMKRQSSLLPTPTARMRTGLSRLRKEKMADIGRIRFTEINEDGSKKVEEDLKGMPSFWLTIFQVLLKTCSLSL